MLRKSFVALCVTCGLFASGASYAGLSDGLVGYWNFDNCDATDTSGNGNTGSTGASCSTGKVGKALIFDGNTWATLPKPSSLHPSAFTISAWVNPTKYSTWAPYGSIIYSNYDGQYNGSFFYISTNGKVGITVASVSSQASDYVVGATTIDTDKWSYVTATFDGITMKVFVNGNQDGSKIASVKSTTSSISPTIAKPSWSELPKSSYFVGGIDEVRFHNRALSDAEIQQSFSTGTCDTTTPYNQGYSAGQSACKANPTSCGISVGASGAGATSGHATYSPTANTVHIPYLDVSLLGATSVYEVDLTVMPNTNPLQLKLQGAKQIQ